MITEFEALDLAEKIRQNFEKHEYVLVGAEFIPARDKPLRMEAVWVVRYQKPQPKGSVIDDGDQLFVVKINPETKAVKVSEPI